MSLLYKAAGREPFAELSRFRAEGHECPSARADTFFELTDALLCADGPG